MQNWIYFVLIAQGIWSITALIDKIVISKGYIKNPLVFITSNGVMNILLVFLLTLFTSIYLPELVKEEIDKKAILTKLVAIVLIIVGVMFVNL